MTKLGFRSLCAALALMGTSAQLLTGCSQASQEESIGQTGTISLALTTPGADGATYGFPDGSYLLVSSAVSSEYILLTGPEAQLSKTLPVGSYTASLYFSIGTTALTRTVGGVTTQVDAQWTNPQPVTFEIVKGQTTPLALHFSVKGLVDLVFDTGTLQLGVDVVQQNSNQAGDAVISGTTNIYYETNNDDTAAYASALAVDQGIDDGVSIGFHSSGDWVQYSSTTVCKQGTISSANATGSAGLTARLAQFAGGSGQLCVYDNGATDQVAIYPGRFGAPPAGQESFLPDASYSFYGGISGLVGDIYDGTTLHQTALEDAAVTNGFFYHLLYDSSSTLLTTAQGGFTGTIHVTP